MRSSRKRSHEDKDDSSSSSSTKIIINNNKQHLSIKDDVTPRHQITGNSNSLHTYNYNPSLSSQLQPKVRILCDIIAKTPALHLERYLLDSGIRFVSQDDVEQVLKLCYSYPGSAVKFFRWASGYLFNGSKHSSKSWNLVVDLLGSNCLFDAMWDAVKSMRKEGLVSLITFDIVYTSYVVANRVQEAILSFEVVEQYGVVKDSLALNCLVRAICRGGKTGEAKEYVGMVKDKVKVDGETFMILLEGWEKEGDVDRARQTFSEMIIDVGWDKRNVFAYDSFLCTLLSGRDGLREGLKLLESMKDRGCLPGMKFFKLAIDECVKKSDEKSAKVVWDIMVGMKGCRPDLALYKSLISLYCNVKDFVAAEKLLDEMVYNGVFPDSEIYSMLFHFMIKHRRLREATPLFKEMVKNECIPLQDDCVVAVKAFIGNGDTYMATKVWRFMIENYSSDLEEAGNVLVVGLQNKSRLPEAIKCAEDMIERGIKVNSATLSKLKQALSKERKEFVYEELLCKWKNH